MTEAIARRTGEAAGSRWRWVGRAVVLVAVVLVVLAAWSAWDRERLMMWKQEVSPLLFFACMSVLPALGFPVMPLFILAGATFGPRLGLVGSVIALGINLVLCYAIATRGFRSWLAKALRRFDYELPDLTSRSTLHVLRFTIAVRLAPGVPAFVKNYGLGLARVPFAIYFIVSLVLTGGLAAALVILGESLLDHRVDRATIVAAIVVAAGLGLWWWNRRTQRAERVTAG